MSDASYLGDSVDSSNTSSPSTTVFPNEWKKSFEGLAYIGYLEDVVTIPFHEFHIRTLFTGEKIEIARIVKDMEGTVGYGRAYRAAVVAAALISVDDQPIVVSEKSKGAVLQKYNYVVTNWFDPIIDLLYEQVNRLEGEVLSVLIQMGIIADPAVSEVKDAPLDGE